MSVTWHCDRTGCEQKIETTPGSIYFPEFTLKRGTREPFEFCSYDCLLLFVVKEKHLL